MRLSKGSIGSVLAGAASLLPSVRDVVGDIVADKIGGLVGPFFGSILAFALPFMPALIFFVLTIYLSSNTAERAAAFEWARKKLNWYLVFTFLFAAGTVASLGLFFWDRSLGPIEWHFDRNQSPIVLNGPGTGPFSVFAINVIGTNRSEDPIKPTEAYVISNVTGRKLLLTFPNERPVQSGTIPPGAEFSLVGLLSPLGSAGTISIPEFRSEFGTFTFVFKSPQNDYSIRFRASDIDKRIVEIEKTLRRDPTPSVQFDQ